MDPTVKKELDTILQMVGNWKAEKIRSATGPEGNEYLVSDLSDEIMEYVFPYIRRLQTCEYITADEMGEFLKNCWEEVDRLKNHFATVGGSSWMI